MAYSTEVEFRANVSIGTVANISVASVASRIAQADLKIQTDLGQIIDFSAIVITPTFINILAQYKTAELCLVYMYGKKRKVEENSDIDYWMNCYNMLLEAVIAGEVPLEDGSTPAIGIAGGQQTFSNTAKDNIEPALGDAKWGDFETKADKALNRPTS